MRAQAALALCLLPLLLPAPGFSQAEEEAAAAERRELAQRDTVRDAFRDVVEVLEIQVPVQVLLKDEPVRGLDRESFRILDRGREREIVGFDVVELGGPGVAPPALAAEEQPSEESDVALGADGRHFLALFDLALSQRSHLARAVAATRIMVAEQLDPRDRLGVAMLTGGGASLVLGFTQDRELLGHALDLVQAALDRSPDAHRRAAARLAERRPESARELSQRVGPLAALVLGDPPSMAERPVPAEIDFGSLVDAGGGISSGLDEAFELSNTLAHSAVLSAVRRMNRSWGDLVTLLQGVPGQKYCLYFSQGLRRFEDQVQSGPSGGGVTEQSWGTGAGTTDAYGDLVQALVRAGWIVQSLDISTLGSGDPGSLFLLAEETGGRLYQNFSHLEQAIERLLDRTSVTYLLTFQAHDVPRDGLFHELEVKLVGARGKVSARNGYWAPKPAAAMSELERLVEDAERLFAEPDTAEIEGALLALVSPLGDGSSSRITVLLRAEPRGLLASGRLEDKLRLEVQAFAGRSDPPVDLVADLLSEGFVLRSEEDGRAFARGGLTFLGDLVVAPGSYVVRARLRETTRGRQLLATRQVLVGSGDRPLLLPPLFISAEPEGGEGQAGAAGMGVLRQEARSEVAKDPGSPLVAVGRLWLPRVDPVVSSVPPSRARLLVRAYGAAWSTASRLEAQVLDDQGRRVAARFEVEATHDQTPRAGPAAVAHFAWLELGHDGEPLPRGGCRLVLRWLEGERELATSAAEFRLE